jgi:hypothetical protein
MLVAVRLQIPNIACLSVDLQGLAALDSGSFV